LRKALGEPEEGDNCKEWISNIPLRGYRFNGTAFREQGGIPADPRLSRVRTGKLALRRAEVDFGALVLDLVAALGARWTSGRIRAQTQAADPLICHADAVRSACSVRPTPAPASCTVAWASASRWFTASRLLTVAS
jgi:hypothetical protein